MYSIVTGIYLVNAIAAQSSCVIGIFTPDRMSGESLMAGPIDSVRSLSGVAPNWYVSTQCLIWPNGSRAFLYQPGESSRWSAQSFDFIWAVGVGSWRDRYVAPPGKMLTYIATRNRGNSEMLVTY